MFHNGILACSTVSAAIVQYKELVQKRKVKETLKRYKGTTSITKKKSRNRLIPGKHLQLKNSV